MLFKYIQVHYFIYDKHTCNKCTSALHFGNATVFWEHPVAYDVFLSKMRLMMGGTNPIPTSLVAFLMTMRDWICWKKTMTVSLAIFLHWDVTESTQITHTGIRMHSTSQIKQQHPLSATESMSPHIGCCSGDLMLVKMCHLEHLEQKKQDFGWLVNILRIALWLNMVLQVNNHCKNIWLVLIFFACLIFVGLSWIQMYVTIYKNLSKPKRRWNIYP